MRGAAGAGSVCARAIDGSKPNTAPAAANIATIALNDTDPIVERSRAQLRDSRAFGRNSAVQLFTGLESPERRVLTALGAELGVGAGYDDATAVDHVNDVGVAHRREPVRDDEARAPDHEARQ